MLADVRFEELLPREDFEPPRRLLVLLLKDSLRGARIRGMIDGEARVFG